MGVNPLISRRELLKRGTSAAGAALLARTTAASPSLPLITKPIPSSGERLPVIGLGTIWYRRTQAAALRQVLERMHVLGGTVIDTAAAYGESEEVIGRALADSKLRSKMFVASKFNAGAAGSGPPIGNGPPQGFARPPGVAPIPGPPTGIERPERDGVGGAASFDRSLARLRTSYLDLLQVHSMSGTDELLPLLVQWKQAKRIRYLGVTTSSPDQHAAVVSAMQRYSLDFVQVDYSLANRVAADRVLPVALERRVGVLVNLPLGRATLLSRLAGTPLPAWAADFDVHSWSQFLLKYVVSHPAVTCAIPGSLHLEHLVDNQGAGRGRLPDAAARTRMEQLWDGLVGSTPT
jgi:aryl-alcohol dehydrogenase-like predicted oxidoreductase